MKKTFLASMLSLMIFAALGTMLVYAQQTPNTGPQTSGTGPQAPNTGPQAPNTGPQAPNTGPQAPNTGPQAPNTGPQTPGTEVGISLDNPFNTGNSLTGLLDNIFNEIVFPIGGILAVLAFIYSGFMYVTAQGDVTKIKTAHTALLYTAVGTAILLGARVISEVIGGTIDQLK